MAAQAVYTKRVYEPASGDDGLRVLIDWLWPRGLSKEKAGVDIWLKDIAPSDVLRNWFKHDPEKWDEFRKRYFKELDANPAPVEELAGMVDKGRVTLLLGARDESRNNAVALKDYIDAVKKKRARIT